MKARWSWGSLDLAQLWRMASPTVIVAPLLVVITRRAICWASARNWVKLLGWPVV